MDEYESKFKKANENGKQDLWSKYYMADANTKYAKLGEIILLEAERGNKQALRIVLPKNPNGRGTGYSGDSGIAGYMQDDIDRVSAYCAPKKKK